MAVTPAVVLYTVPRSLMLAPPSIVMVAPSAAEFSVMLAAVGLVSVGAAGRMETVPLTVTFVKSMLPAAVVVAQKKTRTTRPLVASVTFTPLTEREMVGGATQPVREETVAFVPVENAPPFAL